MQRNQQDSDELNLPDLPVVTGPTLRPQTFGMDGYLRVICQALEVLPNRKELMDRRLREQRLAPVRFDW